MSVDTRLTVGIHILCLLASSGEESLTSEYMAGSVNTNPVVIRRTLARLRARKIVKSQGGAGGGWRLARPADRITLADVLTAVRSGPLLNMHRNDPNPVCPIGARIQQGLKNYYAEAEAALERQLARSTIADVLASTRRSRKKITHT